MAELAEIDDKHLQVIEKGGTNLTVASLVALSRALGVGIAALFTKTASDR